MKITHKNILAGFLSVLTVAAAAVALTSCDALYDDLDPCPQGAKLRFVYDYNMEFANAFPSQVDCLTLLVYDRAGKFVTSVTETSDVLADENWRMTLPLEPGSYSFVAWGGMADDEASFHFSADPAVTPEANLQVALNSDCMTSPKGTQLHPLFYGDLKLDIPSESTDYTEATVYMMKDTNNVRILLQNISGEPLTGADFVFTITDDNTLLNYDNKVVATQPYTYYPWVSGQESAGLLEDNSTPALLAYAELSTSRFMAGSNARLVIKYRADNRVVADIPIVNYLLLLKSQEFATMKAQEFLDRESRWNMVFFMDRQGNWISTYLKINDWIVRINNAKL